MYGQLTIQNAPEYAQRIQETLKGHLWSVATLTLPIEDEHRDAHTPPPLHPDKIDLETNQVLREVKSDNPCLVSVDTTRSNADELDDRVSISFCGDSYHYTFISRLEKGRKSDGWNTPYFSFTSTGFTIRHRHNKDHGVRLYNFKIEGEMPQDTDQYYQSLLDLHFPRKWYVIRHHESGKYAYAYNVWEPGPDKAAHIHREDQLPYDINSKMLKKYMIFIQVGKGRRPTVDEVNQFLEQTGVLQ